MSSAPNAATVTGPSQLRVPTVSVPPGVTAAPQPPTVPVPPPQYPSLAGISLRRNPMDGKTDDRLVGVFVRITAAEASKLAGIPEISLGD